ncbi:MAG TPA: hypothetical protein PLD23_19745, partial [Armatimonadota bacterium]|nr:hypothetical protein [Armatimonadota bacterium]
GGTTGGSGMGGQAKTVAQAEAALEEAELTLTNAELALERATLKAPATGVLTALPFTVGQTAGADDQATVRTTDAVSVTIEVPGQAPVTVYVDQRAAGDGGSAVLGVFDLPAGHGLRVTVSNAETDGYVVADGLQLLLEDD